MSQSTFRTSKCQVVEGTGPVFGVTVAGDVDVEVVDVADVAPAVVIVVVVVVVVFFVIVVGVGVVFDSVAAAATVDVRVVSVSLADVADEVVQVAVASGTSLFQTDSSVLTSVVTSTVVMSATTFGPP